MRLPESSRQEACVFPMIPFCSPLNISRHSLCREAAGFLLLLILLLLLPAAPSMALDAAPKAQSAAGRSAGTSSGGGGQEGSFLGLSLGELRELASREGADGAWYRYVLQCAQEVSRIWQEDQELDQRAAGILADRKAAWAADARHSARLLRDLSRLSPEEIRREVAALERRKEELQRFIQDTAGRMDAVRILAYNPPERPRLPRELRDLLAASGEDASPGRDTPAGTALMALEELDDALRTSYHHRLAMSGETLELEAELLTLSRRALADTERVLRILRSAALERRLAENRITSGDLAAGVPAPLGKLSRDNRELAGKLEEIYRHWGELDEIRSDLERHLADAKRHRRELQSQISSFSRTLFLARRLFDRLEPIPLFPRGRDFRERTEELRILQYDLSEELEKIAVAGTCPRELYPGCDELSGEDGAAFSRLLGERRSLIARSCSEAGAMLSDLLEIRRLGEEYEALRQDFNSSLMQERLWTPSAEPLGPGVFRGAAEDLRELAARIPSGRGAGSWILPAVALILLAALLICRKRLLRIAGMLRDRIGGATDSFYLAWQEAGILLLLALIPTLAAGLILTAVDIFLLPLGGGDGLFIPESLLMIWSAETLILIHGPRGLDRAFFRVLPDPADSFLRALSYRLMVAVIVLHLWNQLEPAAAVEDRLGQLLLFILLLALLIGTLLRLLRLRTAADRPWTYEGGTLDHLTFSPVFLSALGLGGTALLLAASEVLTYFGYCYTALVLTANLTVTVFIADAGVVLCRSVFRAVRLAAARIRLLRAALDSADGQDPHQEVAEISRQAHWFISLICASACIFLIYSLVWDDLVHLTRHFRQVVLYSTSGGSVTLWDLLTVIYALALTLLVCLNFPGFLKMLIFHRVRLLNQYSYSVITVCNYLFIAVCIVYCCRVLGLTWDRLQWLVAALSVGLGFGLQEIFANFVSGLILLFERPVRIGDTVTLDGHSGKVTRIQIRATTITDFDRMEYVVPNRKLITSPLTNWTLSDTVTRVVVRVSCPVAEDTDLIRGILQEVVLQCPLVLREPSPTVFLAGFSGGITNFEIKAFVAANDHRNPCIDALNAGVHRAFARHGIRLIASSVDLHMCGEEGGAAGDAGAGKEPAGAGRAEHAGSGGAGMDPAGVDEAGAGAGTAVSAGTEAGSGR